MGAGCASLKRSPPGTKLIESDFYLCDMNKPFGSPVETGNPEFKVTYVTLVNNDGLCDINVCRWKEKLVIAHTLAASDLPKEKQDYFEAEVRKYLKIRHPNIISIIGGGIDKHNCTYITEYFENNTLDNAIKESRLTKEKDKVKVLKGVLAGIKFLHSLNPPVILEDLRLSTIGLGVDFNPVICSYGFQEMKDVVKMQSITQDSAATIDPSFFTGSKMTTLSDSYSFGIIMTIVWRCEIPFKDKPTLQVFSSSFFSLQILL
eukprot:TRINITY_DN641_c0_g1_i3.p1 TRINITY_DN641_c0_g1~~TRINITY_DN641_c0_g1_i3.p1  ORF type:complete len:261 (+),score=49.19 TRINITY_DN641_c0_g1_i3:83-865(+)